MSGDTADFRLARRLATAGASVEIASDGTNWLVAGKGPRALVAAESVARLRASGALVAGGGGRLRLSPVGRAMVRRRLSGGEGFLVQHQMREHRDITIDDGRQAVTLDLAESPLAWLRSRKGADGRPMIDAAAFEAGERLRSDFTRGQLMPSVTTNWNLAGGSGGPSGRTGGAGELTDAALSARLRVEKAMRAVGPEFAGPLLDLCCFLKGIEAIERERNWPKRSAKLVIQLALASLARHYGLSNEARGPAFSSSRTGQARAV